MKFNQKKDCGHLNILSNKTISTKMLNLCRGPTFRGKHSEVFQNTTNLLKKLSKDFGGASF